MVLFLKTLHLIFRDIQNKMQLLEDNCSIILCWPLPYINVNQPQVYISPVAPKYPSHFPPLEAVTERWAELLAWYGKRPLVICFTYGHVYASTLLSIHPALSFPQRVHKSVPCVCVSIAALQMVHWRYLPRFHTHAFIYDICLSLSDLLHFVEEALGSSTSLGLTQKHFFLMAE